VAVKRPLQQAQLDPNADDKTDFDSQVKPTVGTAVTQSIKKFSSNLSMKTAAFFQEKHVSHSFQSNELSTPEHPNPPTNSHNISNTSLSSQLSSQSASGTLTDSSTNSHPNIAPNGTCNVSESHDLTFSKASGILSSQKQRSESLCCCLTFVNLPIFSIVK
jgi:hypothetical protein